MTYHFYTGFLMFSTWNISFTHVFKRFYIAISISHRFFRYFHPSNSLAAHSFTWCPALWFWSVSPCPVPWRRIESGRWSLENRSNPYVFQQISFLIAVLHRFFNMSKLKYQFCTCFLPFSIRNISFTQVFQRFLFEMSFLHRFFNVFMPKTQFYTGF